MRIKDLAAAAALICGVCSAQSPSLILPSRLLLPSPVHVKGAVVDSAGVPIPHVRIDYIALGSGSSITTYENGHFEFDTRAPGVVFRRHGWRSRLVRVSKSGDEARIVLERTSEPAALPDCSKAMRCMTIDGIFCLTPLPGMHVSKAPYVIDARVRDFTIESPLGHETMYHGEGYVWGGPELSDIWDSVDFSEIQRDAQGQLVLDARGKTSDGKLWRTIGREGEAVSYTGQDEKDAALFDQMLDGLCVVPAAK